MYHNVAWAEAYLRTKWYLNPSSRLAATNMGRKLGDCPFFGGGRSCGSPYSTHNVAWAEAYFHTKWHLDLPSRLATIDMGRKLGTVSLFGAGELDPPLAQRGLGRDLSPYQVAS